MSALLDGMITSIIKVSFGFISPIDTPKLKYFLLIKLINYSLV